MDDARDDPGREQDGDTHHGRSREARDDDGERRDAIPGLGRRREHEQPTSPPIQIDAAARCAQSSASMAPTGLVVDGWPARPGKRERGRGAAGGAEDRQQCLAGTPRAAGPVERECAPTRDGEQGEHHPEVAERTAEARVAYERHDLAESLQGLSENSAVASRR